MLPLSAVRGSPSSRRAWIEISRRWDRTCRRGVALLAEGVDRNIKNSYPIKLIIVALLAEGVDRNKTRNAEIFAALRRPPRGGRG